MVISVRRETEILIKRKVAGISAHFLSNKTHEIDSSGKLEQLLAKEGEVNKPESVNRELYFQTPGPSQTTSWR